MTIYIIQTETNDPYTGSEKKLSGFAMSEEDLIQLLKDEVKKNPSLLDRSSHYSDNITVYKLEGNSLFDKYGFDLENKIVPNSELKELLGVNTKKRKI